MNTLYCPICNRKHGGEMQIHHLKPVTFKTRNKNVHNNTNKVLIHRICHSTIHAFFKEQELYHHYHTVDRLVNSDRMISFIKWIQKKPVEYYIKMKRSNKRK